MHKKGDVFIIDDVVENVKEIIEVLRDEGYGFAYALNPKDAMEILKTKRFDLILLSMRMSHVEGLELCRVIKNTPLLEEIPLIVMVEDSDISEIEKAFLFGCTDYIHSPVATNELKVKTAHHIEFYNYKKSLKLSAQHTKLLSETEDAQQEMVYILSAMVEENNVHAKCHLKRVAHFAKELAILDGHLTKEQIKMIFLAAPLYDIGKIFIEDSIVHKPDQLTTYEFEVIKRHPKLALDVLKNSSKKLINAAAIIAYEHHESYDGTGYPRGLKGDEIHIYARIVAIASVLDALLDKKVYKEAWSFEDSVKYILVEKGKKFDPRLVNLFQEHMEVFKELADEDYS